MKDKIIRPVHRVRRFSKEILEADFGLTDRESLAVALIGSSTLEEAGREMGLSRESVRLVLVRVAEKSRDLDGFMEWAYKTEAQKRCSVCNRPGYSQKLCQKHYARRHFHGSEHQTQLRSRRHRLIAFMQRIRVERGHWIWTAGTIKTRGMAPENPGVPSFCKINSRRLILSHCEPIPHGYWVVPICGEDLCVSPHPDHLRAMTPSQAIRIRTHGDNPQKVLGL